MLIISYRSYACHVPRIMIFRRVINETHARPDVRHICTSFLYLRSLPVKVTFPY